MVYCVEKNVKKILSLLGEFLGTYTVSHGIKVKLVIEQPAEVSCFACGQLILPLTYLLNK